MELIRKEQNSFQYFDKVTSLDRGHSFLFIYLLLIYIYIYMYTFLNITSLTHVTSFRLMTPRPVGLRALGVKTPLRA